MNLITATSSPPGSGHCSAEPGQAGNPKPLKGHGMGGEAERIHRWPQARRTPATAIRPTWVRACPLHLSHPHGATARWHSPPPSPGVQNKQHHGRPSELTALKRTSQTSHSVSQGGRHELPGQASGEKRLDHSVAEAQGLRQVPATPVSSLKRPGPKLSISGGYRRQGNSGHH